jgi:thiol-disulfide isomerase/thioredoxin
MFHMLLVSRPIRSLRGACINVHRPAGAAPNAAGDRTSRETGFHVLSWISLGLAAVIGVSSLEASQAEKKPVASEPAAGQANAVKLRAGTWKDVEALVKQQKGKIVVVDIWSTSCLPCMSEFPRLVEMHNAHKDKVVCISFNVDYVGIKNKPADFYRPRVEEFLKKQKAEFTNYLCTMESDKVFQSLELSSIPAVYVFDREGKLSKRFDDSLFEDGEEEAFTYEKDINPFVSAMLDAE